MNYYGDGEYIGLIKKSMKDVYRFVFKNDEENAKKFRKKASKNIKNIFVMSDVNAVKASCTLTNDTVTKIRLIKNMEFKKRLIDIVIKENELNYSAGFSVYHEITHTITGLNEDLSEKIVDDKIYKNADGNIKCKNNRTEYGILLNENMTDLIALAGYFTGNNLSVDLNKIFKSGLNAYLTTYNVLEDLTKLALAAFNNKPNIDYNELYKNSNLFNSKFRYRNGLHDYTNDLMHYHMYDSKKLMEIFDRYMGQGSFEKVSTAMDNALNSLRYGSINLSYIIYYQTYMDKFIRNKTNYYLKNGRFNKKDAIDYLDEYQNINKRIAGKVKLLISKLKKSDYITLDELKDINVSSNTWYSDDELNSIHKSLKLKLK